MPQFQYQPYEPRSTQSIAELIQAPGKAQAQAALVSGQAQARAAEQSGQAWGNAISTIGQIPQQMQAQKTQAQEQQVRGLQIDKATRDAADQRTFDTTMGAGTDRQAILAQLPAHLRSLALGQWKAADEADANAKKLKTEAAAAELDYFGSLAAGVKEWLPQGPEVTLGAAKLAIEHAVAAGHQDAGQLWEQIQADPSKLPAMLDSILAQSPKYAALARQDAAQAETARHNVASETTTATNQATDNARLAAAQAETARHNRATEGQAAKRLTLAGGSGADGETVAYWIRQIQNDPTQWSMLANNKPLQQAVQDGLAKNGANLNKLTSQGRAMQETAREILPHISTIEQEAADLDRLGLMGPIAGRWRDFAAGKIGAGELAGGSGENATKIGKFQTDVGLMMTAVARAHGGARGGGSPAMLAHMKEIMDAHGKDLATFMGNLSATKDWMQGYADMGQGTASATAVKPPDARYNPATGVAEPVH